MPPEDVEVEPDFELAAELEVGLTEEQLLDMPPEQRAADSSELSGELDNGKGEGAQNTQNGQGGQGAKTGKSGPGRDAA
jgi:hypothetical protein